MFVCVFLHATVTAKFQIVCTVETFDIFNLFSAKSNISNAVRLDEGNAVNLVQRRLTGVNLFDRRSAKR